MKVAAPPRHLFDKLGGELTVGRRRSDELQPARFLGRTRLVAVDVCGVDAYHRTPARQGGLQGKHVRTGAVEHGKGLCTVAEVLPHDVAEPFSPGVAPVARGVPDICRDDRVDHLGVGPRPVV